MKSCFWSALSSNPSPIIRMNILFPKPTLHLVSPPCTGPRGGTFVSDGGRCPRYVTIKPSEKSGYQKRNAIYKEKSLL